jgi:hypothetical protein
MYFGNNPLSASYLTDYFSGNNTTVAFTLSRAPVSASSVIITISGVKQAASTYGVSGTTLTFSAAPPTGTNNIEVLHLGVQPDTVVQPSYRTITEFTATAGQTTFSPASYTVGYIDVYRNGVKLGSADFTATNGTSVVLANACALGDYVRFEGFLITSFNNAITNTAGAVGDSLIASVSASKLTGSRTLPNTVVPAGSVLQVVSTTKTDTASTSSGTFNDITGLSVSITPTSTSSKILVLLNVTGGNNDGGAAVQLVRDSTAIAIATSATGNRINASFGNYYNNADANSMRGHGLTHLDSPSTTSAVTYKAQFRVGQTSGGREFYINRANGNDDATYNIRTVSTITVMEIAA